MAQAEALATSRPAAGRSRGPWRSRMRRTWERYWFAYAMLAPVMIVMLVLVFYPLARGIWLSFTDANQYTLGSAFMPPSYQWIGFDNYIEVLTSKEFRSVLQFTAVWTVVNVFFHFTLGLGLAVLLNRPMRLRGTYRVLLMVPWAVPSFISAFAWRFLFNTPYGFFDQLARELGFQGPAWLGDPFWAKVAVITTNVWLGVPFMMVALLGGMQAIDRDLLDAAAVDGASNWRRFWDVTMPGLRPVAATVILLGLIWTFNMFNVIFLITQGGPGTATQILSTFAYRYGFDFREYSVASTYGVIILSILLLMAGAYRRLLRSLGEETWQ